MGANAFYILQSLYSLPFFTYSDSRKTSVASFIVSSVVVSSSVIVLLYLQLFRPLWMAALSRIRSILQIDRSDKTAAEQEAASKAEQDGIFPVAVKNRKERPNDVEMA